LFPDDVGAHVGVTVCKKSPAKVAMAITAAKRQKVAVLRHAVLSSVVIPQVGSVDLATLFWGVGESCF
jgi:hypothetical protein